MPIKTNKTSNKWNFSIHPNTKPTYDICDLVTIIIWTFGLIIELTQPGSYWPVKDSRFTDVRSIFFYSQYLFNISQLVFMWWQAHQQVSKWSDQTAGIWYIENMFRSDHRELRNSSETFWWFGGGIQAKTIKLRKFSLNWACYELFNFKQFLIKTLNW